MNQQTLNRWLPFLLPCIVLLLLVGAIFSQTSEPPAANYDESRVVTYTLPDPLVFNDGRPVRTAADWTKHRRAELLELFATNVYGHRPTPPKKLNYEVFDTDQSALGGKAIRKEVTIYFAETKEGPKETILIYIPKEAPKPAPVFLMLS